MLFNGWCNCYGKVIDCKDVKVKQIIWILWFTAVIWIRKLVLYGRSCINRAKDKV